MARPSFERPAERERHAEGAREVGGDRGGLRDDRQVVVAEDLVAAAGDRVVGGGEHAEQHVVDGVVAAVAACGGARRRRSRRSGSAAAPGRWGAAASGDGGVGLVARRTDRVVAPADGAHPAGGEVELAARDLGAEQRPQTFDLRLGGHAARARRHFGAAANERLQRRGSASSRRTGSSGRSSPHADDVTAVADSAWTSGRPLALR